MCLMSKLSTKAKRILKSELIKRGVTNTELASRLNAEGLSETKSSIDSKISRGKFSASFFLQCLKVIGCNKIDIEDYSLEVSQNLIAAEEEPIYKSKNDE